MASNPPCMTDDGNAAVFTGTFFEDGSSITVCPDCLVTFMTVMLQQMTSAPVESFMAAVQSGEIPLVTQSVDDESVDETEPLDATPGVDAGNDPEESDSAALDN